MRFDRGKNLKEDLRSMLEVIPEANAKPKEDDFEMRLGKQRQRIQTMKTMKADSAGLMGFAARIKESVNEERKSIMKQKTM
jgi:hypothetical protein